MADIKKLVFNPDAAEEYFSMLLTSYRDTANDIFRRDNEGRHASEQHYSAEYLKYVGMQIAMREVLEYFGKFDLGDWISVKDRLPEQPHKGDAREWYIVALKNGVVKELAYEFLENSLFGYGWRETAYPVTHWKPLPQPPEEEKHGTE